MKVLVWILIVGSHYNVTTFSPPMDTLADCERMQKQVQSMNVNGIRPTACVQVTIIK